MVQQVVMTINHDKVLNGCSRIDNADILGSKRHHVSSGALLRPNTLLGRRASESAVFQLAESKFGHHPHSSEHLASSLQASHCREETSVAMCSKCNHDLHWGEIAWGMV